MFESYLSLGGVEVANVDRLVGYAKSADCAVSWLKAEGCGTLNDALGEDFPYTLETIDKAPWYDPSRSDVSSRFFGIMVIESKGLSDSSRQLSITEGILDGGTIGGRRRAAREATFKVLLVAEGQDALEYGMSWLSSALDGDECGQHGSACGLVDMAFLTECPPEAEYLPVYADEPEVSLNVSKMQMQPPEKFTEFKAVAQNFVKTPIVSESNDGWTEGGESVDGGRLWEVEEGDMVVHKTAFSAAQGSTVHAGLSVRNDGDLPMVVRLSVFNPEKVEPPFGAEGEAVEVEPGGSATLSLTGEAPYQGGAGGKVQELRVEVVEGSGKITVLDYEPPTMTQMAESLAPKGLGFSGDTAPDGAVVRTEWEGGRNDSKSIISFASTEGGDYTEPILAAYREAGGEPVGFIVGRVSELWGTFPAVEIFDGEAGTLVVDIDIPTDPTLIVDPETLPPDYPIMGASFYSSSGGELSSVVFPSSPGAHTVRAGVPAGTAFIHLASAYGVSYEITSDGEIYIQSPFVTNATLVKGDYEGEAFGNTSTATDDVEGPGGKAEYFPDPESDGELSVRRFYAYEGDVIDRDKLDDELHDRIRFMHDVAVSSGPLLVEELPTGKDARFHGAIMEFTVQSERGYIYTVPRSVDVSGAVLGSVADVDYNLVPNPGFKPDDEPYHVVGYNLCPNPSLEVDATGWSSLLHTTQGRVVGELRAEGEASFKVTKTLTSAIETVFVRAPRLENLTPSDLLGADRATVGFWLAISGEFDSYNARVYETGSNETIAEFDESTDISGGRYFLKRGVLVNKEYGSGAFLGTSVSITVRGQPGDELIIYADACLYQVP